MSKIILVTGGARSGKSTFAEKLALDLTNNNKAYIATAQIFDDEMAQRVKLHQARRNKTWVTFEAPFEAEKAIEESNKIADVILFDCMTIYISNFLCAYESLDDIDSINAELKNIINKLIKAAKRISGTIIFVTNEVGAGIVPENKLARVFRDCAGIANQMIAAEAAEVYLVVCGIPVTVKK
ncbi:MAG: bifunctional adenosylcobinamide kinase/adenosylcobinamide-phosphate guanylyltransferase [Selenomonadaceae bacterium]|nr:bifunctional adenosylcobinamide kinase/adenosylcobinamide-phosphate guanylyltransferase [Selenomonadaceae bacterium]